MPFQVMNADSLREMGQELAAAIGKSFVRTGSLEMKGSETEVTFVCSDGRYRGVIDGDDVEVYEAAEGGARGALIKKFKRS